MAVDSSFEKFRIFRIAHTEGPEAALRHANDAIELRSAMPLPLLDVLSAKAWLEKRTNGSVERTTRSEIDKILQNDVTGRTILLRTEGFLD